MTEDEAVDWLRAEFGSACEPVLRRYVDAVIAENAKQNLIAPSTIATIWTRHIVDSAQLVPLADPNGAWLDIGSGAGLPGLVAAILRPAPVLLVEPRRQRAAFLERSAAMLGLSNVQVIHSKVESLALAVAVISARAVASVDRLLLAASACSTSETRWLLPRGRVEENELAALQRRWRGLFHMKQSVTDERSTILICEQVARR